MFTLLGSFFAYLLITAIGTFSTFYAHKNYFCFSSTVNLAAAVGFLSPVIAMVPLAVFVQQLNGPKFIIATIITLMVVILNFGGQYFALKRGALIRWQRRDKCST